MSTENTEGINGDYAALNNLTAGEYGKPSAAAKKMGAVAPSSAPAMTTAQVATDSPYIGGITTEGESASNGPIDPVAEAQKIERSLNPDVYVFDGDTIARGGNRYRIGGIDAFESDQPFGKAARDKLREIIRNAEKLEIIERGTDAHGRTVAKVIADGADVALSLLEGGYAVPYGGDETEDSATYFAAGERAKAAGAGAYGVEGGVLLPSAHRRVVGRQSDYEERRFRASMDILSARLEKVYPSDPATLAALAAAEGEKATAKQAAAYEGKQNAVTSAAARGSVDAVIAPAQTRKHLIMAFSML